MRTDESNIINQGAAVKGDPNLNAAALVMATEALPGNNMVRENLVTSPVPRYNVPVPAAPLPLYNTAKIGSMGSTAGIDNSVLMVGAAGLGALLLLNSGSKVSGKKERSLLPALLIGGAALWYFTSQKAAAPVVPDTELIAYGDNISVIAGQKIYMPAPGLLANDTGGQGLNIIPGTFKTFWQNDVKIWADGAFEVTASAVGFTGLDFFDYTLQDAAGRSQVGRIYITVKPV